MTPENSLPLWVPSSDVIERANISAVLRQLGLPDFAALHRWSVENRSAYWQLVVERLGIRFRTPAVAIADLSRPIHPRWLVGAKLNIVDSCFLADRHLPAIIESGGAGELRTWTYGELSALAARVANALPAMGISPGDSVGVVMPMTARAVAVYLGIIAAGAVVVSIADSFAPDEIATRLRLAGAKIVFTQDFSPWGRRRLPLYDKVISAAGERRVVVIALDEQNPPALRDADIHYAPFLSDDDRLSPVIRNGDDPINILFSSGTTGEPKAIPWDQTTPLKPAADAHFHQDIHPGDVVCWPTSLGWMMGPWLIFATLLNRATMALYAQSPTDAGFGKFVQNAAVNMLGLVPSLVRAWRQSRCMEGLDWSNIRVFSSTGECSNPDDMRYLSVLAGGRPIIEYCGGTEIGGAYVTSTVVQPNVASAFSTPALGLDFVLLDEERKPADRGEVFIEGPSIGLSTRLLNRDHDAIYFSNTPMAKSGTPLRRHGDELETLPGGYFRVAGRSDDTMNLGGIKVACAEIERVLNPLPGVHETAAVAVAPQGGGPSRLVIFLVAAIGIDTNAEALRPVLQQAIRSQLNPLFHIDEVRVVASLPRTSSNKVMRRALRAMLG